MSRVRAIGRPRRLLALSLTLAPVAGCDDASSPARKPDAAAPRDLATPPPFCTDGVDGGPPATLASVTTILHDSCVFAGCHDAGPAASPVHMDLRPGHVYDSIVGVPASETCGGTRVVPGAPASSYLFQKLTTDRPCKGEGMPLSEVGQAPLPACEIAILRAWIAGGAAR